MATHQSTTIPRARETRALHSTTTTVLQSDADTCAVTPQRAPAAKARRLKVSASALRPSTWVPPTSSRLVPYLRLRGRWLKAAGFTIGQNVRVEVGEGRLLIEPVG